MTLVIDFGTVNTVAMLDGRLVTVDGAPWLPSVVHGDVVGADAVALAGDRVARDMKARLDPAEVRTLFARVLSAARDQGGVIGDVVVTHPAAWPPERVAVLTSAAGAWTRALPEPVAIAAAAGAGPVLVVDAGGGPWTVAAVRGQSVLATATLPFGGNDVDALIVARVRPSLRSSADDSALLASARAGKELLSRHETTEIVLPDHRAVRLDRAEFDRMVGHEVDRLAALAAQVGGAAGARQVVLAGGSSRMPLLARRIAEVTGLPVITDPEPETAVVRGAQLLTRPAALEDPLADLPPATEPAPPAGSPAAPPGSPGGAPPVAPAAGSPARSPAAPAAAPAAGSPAAPAVAEPARSRPVPNRKPLALVLVLLLVAAIAVVAGGERVTSGRAVAVDLPPPLPEATIPPAASGNEVVNTRGATFTSGAMGEAAGYRHPAGNTFAVTLTGIETAVTAPQPYGAASDGFRWLVIRLHVANTDGPDFAHDPMEDVAVLDDRGQWLRQPYGAGQFACADGVPPPNRIPAGGEVDLCGVVSVPDATPVTAVLFGVRSPEAQAPLRFPASVPVVRDRHAPIRVVGKLGGHAVSVDGLRAEVDLVRAPSGYLTGQVPAPGHRFVVVRVAVTATGQRTVRVVLRDDRGAFLSGRVDALRGCPPLPETLVPETPAYGCHVFEVAARTPVAAVTFVGRGPDTTRWPTWR
jgi:actin-like ATPase involved in cell morphogenesis